MEKGAPKGAFFVSIQIMDAGIGGWVLTAVTYLRSMEYFPAPVTDSNSRPPTMLTFL
jgi:hypothetical protein